MLNLSEQTSRKRPPRTPQRAEISLQAARKRAVNLLREFQLLPLAEQVIRALAVAGVLTTGQLDQVCGVKPRTLRKYHSLYFVDRIPILVEELKARGLSDHPRNLRLYKLGPVGEEIGRRLFEASLPVGYSGYGAQRIVHDVLTNESVLRLAATATRRGFEPIWRSKYEAKIHGRRGSPALEPDAMLTLTRGGSALHFFIEFHNEDHMTRASAKIERYQRAYRDGRWQEELQLDYFPPVLAVFSHKITGKGYQKAMAGSGWMGMQCTFLGKSWESLVQGSEGELALWWNFQTQSMENILELRESH